MDPLRRLKAGKPGAFWSTGAAKEQTDEWPRRRLMSVISIIKLLFATAILLLLVLIGLNNGSQVDFNLPPLLTQVVHQPAALMYFAFFAIGLMTGAILSLGGGKKLGKSTKS